MFRLVYLDFVDFYQKHIEIKGKRPELENAFEAGAKGLLSHAQALSAKDEGGEDIVRISDLEIYFNGA